MTNPFFDAHPTSLGSMSETDWRAMSAHWSMFGETSFCRKFGRKWTAEGFGIRSAPLFNTKREAGEYVSNLIRAESRHRRMLQWDREPA